MRRIQILVLIGAALFATTSLATQTKVHRFEGRTRLQTHELRADVEISFHDEAAIVVSVTGNDEVRETIWFDDNADVVLVATNAKGHSMFDNPGQIYVFAGPGALVDARGIKVSNGGRVVISASSHAMPLIASWRPTQALPKVLIRVPRNNKMFLDAKEGKWKIHGSHRDMQATFGDYYQAGACKFKVKHRDSDERFELKIEAELDPYHFGAETWEFATPPWKFES